MDKSVLYSTDDGTPQGGIISPVLANMALDGLERILRKKVTAQAHQEDNISSCKTENNGAQYMT